MGKIKIAFDLDGIIIDKPPLVPKKLIEKLFRGFKTNGLHYRFPKSKTEQKIRKISHFYLFRPPINKNIEFIKNLSRNKRYELYIISSRYSFIQKETEIWLKKRSLDNIFKNIYLNLKNKQPHFFKEEIIRKLRPEIFVEDDGLIADYLAEKKICQVFCLPSSKARCFKARVIKTVSEIVGQ